MKKTLIAVLCVIPLCLSSCASAPEEEPVQEQAPQLEAAETTQNEISEEEKSDSEEERQDNETADEILTENEEPAETEEYPEPEAFIEPEVITLEPVEEAEPSQNEPVSEEVEKEEPPEITIVKENESVKDAAETETQNEVLSSVEKAPSTEEENSPDDISSNDIVIEENNSNTDDITGGIDITDASDSNNEYSDTQKEIIPSRSVTLKKFEYLDVTYPGTGWIYMGLTDNSKDLSYFGRKLGTKDTKFSLQARSAGTKIIHFYKNDPLTGQYLDDYIEVIITSENGSNKTHIEAPEYVLPVQKKEKQIQKTEEEPVEVSESQATSALNSAETKTEATSANSTKTAQTVSANSTTKDSATKTDSNSATTDSTTTKTASNSAASSEVSSTASETVSSETAVSANPASLLQEAQVLYNEKEYSAALTKLNQFFEFSTDNRDEALYLKGQILEAKSSVRDIKGAIEAYTTLTKNYPASKLWDSANKRIIYLKRFYLEVR